MPVAAAGGLLALLPARRPSDGRRPPAWAPQGAAVLLHAARASAGGAHGRPGASPPPCSPDMPAPTCHLAAVLTPRAGRLERGRLRGPQGPLRRSASRADVPPNEGTGLRPFAANWAIGGLSGLCPQRGGPRAFPKRSSLPNSAPLPAHTRLDGGVHPPGPPAEAQAGLTAAAARSHVCTLARGRRACRRHCRRSPRPAHCSCGGAWGRPVDHGSAVCCTSAAPAPRLHARRSSDAAAAAAAHGGGAPA